MSTLGKSELTSVEDDNIGFIHHRKYEHLVAGVAGGTISTLILHPLDLLKIRFEVEDGMKYKLHYKGILNSLYTIFKQEGITGLYRGAVPGLLGSGASWGFYFYFYTAMKAFRQDGEINRPLSAIQHVAAASEAGILTLILTNPFWVTKTRLCLQSSTQSQLGEKYGGFIDALVKIYRQDGILGWYKGFIPGILGISHGAIQFMVYEECKNRYNKHRGTPISTKLGVTEYLTFAAVSKLFAVATTYPYQVVRARLQNQFYSYDGLWDCLKTMWLYEGWRGFYKGLGTNLLRVVPATMITFVVYENISYGLISLRSKP